MLLLTVSNDSKLVSIVWVNKSLIEERVNWVYKLSIDYTDLGWVWVLDQIKWTFFDLN